MITSINSTDNRIVNFNGNIKTASNKTLARLHYIKFLQAEDKFFKTSAIYEQQTSDLSLKTIKTVGRGLRDFAKLAYERLASAYYYNKH